MNSGDYGVWLYGAAARRAGMRAAPIPGPRGATDGVWSFEVRQWAQERGLSVHQARHGVRRSGLYPLRCRTGYVWWSLTKPRPWDADRETGRLPKRQTRDCVTCGRRFRPVTGPADW